MNKLKSLLLLAVLALSANSARADGTSYVNTFASPEDTFEVTLTLASSTDVNVLLLNIRLRRRHRPGL